MFKGVASIDPAIAELKKELKPFINKKAIIIIPYGVGNHVDHLLTSKICRESLKNVIFYSDFPYNVRLNNYGKTTGMQVYELQPDMQKKSKLLQLYKTQFKGLFPDASVPEHKEVYFIPETNDIFTTQK
jgi:LmbE family N-acetylglucosaminyl deacetylase